VTIGLESMGVPLPGESMVIAASLYAGSTHRLSIITVVVAAALGAIIGDNIGFLIGRELGCRLLKRYGHYIGVDQHRLNLGQYLFRHHGGKVVFFGRFVAILRTFAALLAGANRMPWPDFLLYNALGGVTWACLYGFGAYLLGKAVTEFAKPVGIGIGIAAAVVVVGVGVFLKRNEARLTEAAEREVRADPPKPGGLSAAVPGGAGTRTRGASRPPPASLPCDWRT
jgi:membrane protein DedA with SNARE-associated domain